ncbi:MAG: hypothetical protein MH321_08190 [Leptospiraceae bacterium]|nr:hypothetical protein [Leptospiraceae bacterium]
MIRIILLSILLFLFFRWIFRIYLAFRIGSEAVRDSRYRVYRSGPYGNPSGPIGGNIPREKDVTDRGRVIED